MNWILLGLLSAALLGLYDIFRKSALTTNAVLPVLWISTLFSALPFALLAATGHVTIPGDHIVLLLIALKSLIVATSWVLEFFALKHLPLTVAAPIRATQPFFTLLGAVLIFGEQLTPGRWAGIGLTLLGCLALSLGPGARPRIRLPGRHTLFAIAATLIGAISSLYDKHLLTTRQLDPLLVQTWYTFGIVLLLLPVLAILWYPQRRTSTPFHWHPAIPLVGLTLAASDFLYFTALAQPASLIALLAAIRRANVIIPFLYAALLLQEQQIHHRTLALLGILAGAILMILS